MDKMLRVERKLHRAFNDLAFDRVHSMEEYNYRPEHGEKNWSDYEKFTIGYTSLNIPWEFKQSISVSSFCSAKKEDVADLYQYFLQWVFVCNRGYRIFPSRFYKQADLLHGVMSLHAERMRLMTLYYYFFQELRPLSQFEDSQPIKDEIYFFNKENELQRIDLMIFYLLQQSFVEKRILKVLFSCVETLENPYQSVVTKIFSHYDVQVEYLKAQMHKFWELAPKMKETWDIEIVPKLHYLEKFADFPRLSKVLEKLEPGILNQISADFYAFCMQNSLGKRRVVSVDPVSDFSMNKDERRKYHEVLTQILQKYRGDVDKIMDEFQMQNDKYLRTAYSRLQMRQPYQDHFHTGIYEYYTVEQNKIQWHVQDVHNYMRKLGKPVLTDNDYELCEIIKEIAYCEGFSYTIGYQNMCHCGRMQPFAVWNVQQCHEELKHYHAIRALLQTGGISTKNLDEQFLSQTFEVPTPDAYKDQYCVFMVNFLGETHNIRAYLLLADAFENKEVGQIMRWIADDEVVHKKAFALHFNYLKKKDPSWEKNSYECMVEEGLGIHQAGRCSAYHEMMKKIGNYYAKTGKTAALEFLNMSMRAQYLELKTLYSSEVFKISEFDYRQKHLKAYVW